MFDSLEFIEVIFPGFLFVVGLCLGSFANVFIYRWPKGESVVAPSSRCQSCGKKLLWRDNIPVLGWLIRRGRCRFCGNKFSIRYLIVELVMGSLFVTAFHFIGFNWFLLEVLIFIFGLVTASVIDLDHFLLPDVITLSGIVIGLIGALLNPERYFLDSLLGVLFGGGILWAIAYFYLLLRKEEGMGGGDIKLLAWIGAILGWKALPFVIICSSVVGTLFGLVIAIRSKKGLKTVIPFGPYLALGAVLFLFGGQGLAEWYLHLFLPFLNAQ